MPRISHDLIRKAWKTSRYLPPILSVTRDLPSAISELRWLTEHVVKTSRPNTRQLKQHHRLLKLVRRRANCEPLQYILGSQPFCALDIKCRKGVLIPRPETEAYVQHIIDLYKKEELHRAIHNNVQTWKAHELSAREGTPSPKDAVRPLKILDACSGTGSIGLALLHGILPLFPYTLVNGVDTSPTAVSLARENLQRNLHKFKEAPKETEFRCRFHEHDIFAPFPKDQQMFDIIVSNPPYISPLKFKTETERSVRIWEPKSALVPPMPSDFNQIRSIQKFAGDDKIARSPQDIFYRRLLKLHETTFSKILVMEVGDAAQAIRVLNLALNNPRSEYKLRLFKTYNKCEIWRDHPGMPLQPGAVEWISIGNVKIPIKGAGRVRCVVISRTQNWEPERGIDYWSKNFRWNNRTARLERVFHLPKLNRRKRSKEKKRAAARAKELNDGPRIAKQLGETLAMREERNQAGRTGQKGWGGGKAEMGFDEWRAKSLKRKEWRSTEKSTTIATLRDAYGGAKDTEDRDDSTQSSEHGMSPLALSIRKKKAELFIIKQKHQLEAMRETLRRTLQVLERAG